jgi:hypothetical protein
MLLFSLATQDACSKVDCGANPRVSPSPELELYQATAEFCCDAPALQRPQVQLVVSAEACNATLNGLLAEETWRQITEGMTADEAALIEVLVESCSTAKVRMLSQRGIGENAVIVLYCIVLQFNSCC